MSKVCPRCCKINPASIHTCSPTQFARDLERKVQDLTQKIEVQQFELAKLRGELDAARD